MTYPGHGPEVEPVAGHGCERWKSRFAVELRSMWPRLSREQDAHRAVEPLRGVVVPRVVELELADRLERVAGERTVVDDRVRLDGRPLDLAKLGSANSTAMMSSAFNFNVVVLLV